MQHHKIGGNQTSSGPSTHKRVSGTNDDGAPPPAPVEPASGDYRPVPAAVLAEVRALLTPYASGTPPEGAGGSTLAPADTLRTCMDLLLPWL